MFKLFYSFLFCCFFFTSQLTTQAAEISLSVDKETNLSGWKLTKNNFQIELIQRSPQQTRSFFQARGFNAVVANNIATHCVLQTIIRNTESQNSKDSISVSLKNWRMTTESSTEETPIKLKEAWAKEWQENTVPNSARIAFRWATFPTEQTFEPGGDFNWGMISVGLKPNKKFDLHIFWKQNNKPYDSWIRNMQCPPDNP